MASVVTMLLVEGETDKEYFELLRDKRHGAKRLVFDGEIVPYGGADALSNTVLLRFIKNRYKKLFVTYDLDKEKSILKAMRALDMKRNADYLAMGISEAGKRSIEGLLPDGVRSKVYSREPTLVSAATQGNPEERKSANSNLKRLLLDEFKKEATPGEEYYAKFYPIVKAINKSFR